MAKGKSCRLLGLVLLVIALPLLTGCTNWILQPRGEVEAAELTEREKDIIEALGNRGTNVFDISSSSNLGNCMEYWVDHYVRGQFKERLAAGTMVVSDRQNAIGGNTRIILSYHEDPTNSSKLWKLVLKLKNRILADDLPELDMKNVQSWSQDIPKLQPIAIGEPFTLLTVDMEKAVPAPVEVVQEEMKGGAHMVRLLVPHTYILRAKFIEKWELQK